MRSETNSKPLLVEVLKSMTQMKSKTRRKYLRQLLHLFEILHSNLQIIIWLGALYELSPSQISNIWKEYRYSFPVIDEELKENAFATEAGRQNTNITVQDEDSKRLESKVNDLAESLSLLISKDGGKEFNTRSTAKGTPRRENNPHIQRPVRYSSIGTIPSLPEYRSREHSSNRPNFAELIKAFSHPQSKFTGSGEVTENLGSYHQSFVNLCKIFKLTQHEALDNLYILIKTDREAGRFYSKHVVARSNSHDEAFEMMYSIFMSESRRDRLLHKWNNLQISNFMPQPVTTLHKALRELCSTASSIQLQLGEFHQHEQHLRDALMNACKNEIWAHRLAVMPT